MTVLSLHANVYPLLLFNAFIHKSKYVYNSPSIEIYLLANVNVI